MVTIPCPICAKPLKVRESLVGKKGKCPGCQGYFFVEEVDDSTAPNGGCTVVLKPEGAVSTDTDTSREYYFEYLIAK